MGSKNKLRISYWVKVPVSHKSLSTVARVHDSPIEGDKDVCTAFVCPTIIGWAASRGRVVYQYATNSSSHVG